jgi:hypothetical protein
VGEWQGVISQFSWWQIILFLLIGIMQVLFFVTLLGSFFVAFGSLMQIIAKSGWPYDEPEDAKLTWMQRTAIRQTRAASAFSPKLAKEWKRFGIATGVCLGLLIPLLIFAQLTTH